MSFGAILKNVCRQQGHAGSKSAPAKLFSSSLGVLTNAGCPV